VIAYSCDDGPNELWSLENSQILGIGTENGTSKCLTAPSSGPGLVTLSTCISGNQYQEWMIFKCADGGTYDCPVGVTANVIESSFGFECLNSSGGHPSAVARNSWPTRAPARRARIGTCVDSGTEDGLGNRCAASAALTIKIQRSEK